MGSGKQKPEDSVKHYYVKDPVDDRELLFDGDTIDWIFSGTELRNIQYMWRQEIHVNYMATFLKRDVDEVILAIMHLARGNRLERRKCGLLEGYLGPFARKRNIEFAKGNGEQHERTSKIAESL